MQVKVLLAQGTDQLRESLRTADQHLTRLSAVERLLTADITNKRRAHQVDEQILRVRRQLHAATV